jgi:hypothetical protein
MQKHAAPIARLTGKRPAMDAACANERCRRLTTTVKKGVHCTASSLQFSMAPVYAKQKQQQQQQQQQQSESDLDSHCASFLQLQRTTP